MGKYKVQSAAMSFGGVNYKVRNIPTGKGVQSDPVDVTTLDDTEEQFIPGAIVKNKEITVVAQGITDAPAINSTGELIITANFNDGTTSTPKTVNCGTCILKDITPPDPEANGERGANWTLVFQPAGATAAAADSSSAN